MVEAANEKTIRLEEEIARTRSPKTKCSLLIDVAMELRNSNPAMSMEKAGEAIDIAGQISFTIGKARGYFCMGLAHFNLSNYGDSFVFLTLAYELFTVAGDKWGISNALNHIGLIHLRLGNYTKALENFTSSLQIKKDAHDGYGTANVLISMAAIYRETEDLKEAKELLQESLRISEEKKFDEIRARILLDLGIVLMEENATAAIEKFEEAKRLYAKKNNHSGIAQCILQLGKIKSAAGDSASAIFHFEEGKTIAMASNDKSLLSVFLCEVASEKIKNDSADAAIPLLHEARNIASITQEKPVLKRIAQQLSAAHEMRGDLREALAEFKNFISLKDEINSIETATRLRNQQISARMEALEQEKKMLELEKFAAIESVRARISRDMHDEIGSGLTRISLLNERLKLKLATSQKEPEPVIDRIGSTSREIMSSLNQIIWSTNPLHDNLAGMLSYFRDYISNFLNDTSVDYTIEFPDLLIDFTDRSSSENETVDQDKEIPNTNINPDLRRNLFLVMKESLHNVAKYANATHVLVGFYLSKNQFRFEIADNGKGISEEKKNAFGNGLRNMKQRVESVNGKFEISSEQNKGTRIKIEGQLF